MMMILNTKANLRNNHRSVAVWLEATTTKAEHQTKSKVFLLLLLSIEILKAWACVKRETGNFEVEPHHNNLEAIIICADVAKQFRNKILRW